MPGFLGVLRAQAWDHEPTGILQRMAEPIRYVASQDVRCCTLGRFAGAVVDYGRDYGFLKPAMAKRDAVQLFIDGEVFPDASEVPHELSANNPLVQRADYCLDLYLKCGPSFASQLNGSFAIAVFDSRADGLYLYTDRFCSRPLYVWNSDAECAFASSVRPLLCYRSDIGTAYDREAVAELVGFERVFGEKTLFPDIKRLPAACQATWDGRRWNNGRYIGRMGRQTIGGLRSWRETAEELVVRLRRAVDKRTSDGAGTSVLLSGGIDSRLLLAVAVGAGATGATLVNKGASPSRETRVAVKAAMACNASQIFLERAQDHYSTVAELAPDVTDGLVTFVGCHSLGLHDQLEGTGTRVTMSGMFFDTAFKCYFGEQRLAGGLYPTGPQELHARRMGRTLVDTALIRRADRLDLMALTLNEGMREVLAVARERRIRDIAEWCCTDMPLAEAADRLHFNSLQSAGGYVGFLPGMRSRFADRSPIHDNALFELGASTPVSFKLRGRLVRQALWLVNRRAAWIADANTDLPACLCSPWDWLGVSVMENSRRMGQRLARISKSVAKLRQPARGQQVFTHATWHDLNAALRTSSRYRALVETALAQLDPGMFDLARLHKLLEDDLTCSAPRLNVVFEMALTFGLFHRKWGPQVRSRTAHLTSEAIK